MRYACQNTQDVAMVVHRDTRTMGFLGVPENISANKMAKPKYEINNQKHVFLVGGLNPSEKYDFVNWDD